MIWNDTQTDNACNYCSYFDIVTCLNLPKSYYAVINEIVLEYAIMWIFCTYSSSFQDGDVFIIPKLNVMLFGTESSWD